MEMKILVTSFDPFGNDAINASSMVLQDLPNCIQGMDLIKMEIPTIAYTSLTRIHDAIQQYDPDFILSLGQAKGRSDITVERVGINIHDFRIPDNAGNQYINLPIYQDGPDAYFSNLPIYHMVEAIRQAGIGASISNSAGTFVCNHVLYGVRYMLEHEYPQKRSGFIHLPCLKEQIRNEPYPTMECKDMVEGVEAAIAALAQDDKPLYQGEGTIC